MVDHQIRHSGWGTILAQADRNLNETIFKSSNAQGLPKGGGGGRGMLKLRIDRRIKLAGSPGSIKFQTDFRHFD